MNLLFLLLKFNLSMTDDNKTLLIWTLVVGGVGAVVLLLAFFVKNKKEVIDLTRERPFIEFLVNIGYKLYSDEKKDDTTVCVFASPPDISPQHVLREVAEFARENGYSCGWSAEEELFVKTGDRKSYLWKITALAGQGQIEPPTNYCEVRIQPHS